MQQQTSKDDLEAIIAQAESAQGLRHSTSQDDGGNDTDERDPAIQRARVVFGQPIRHPIHVVTPKDYDVIGLPPALRRTASDGEGFRVWRGPKPDEPIYINGQSGIYKRASDRSARGIDDLLLASVLLHEATHETEKGPVGEGAALRLQADWLRSKLGTLKSADEQRWAEHFLTIIETQSRELLKQQGGSAR